MVLRENNARYFNSFQLFTRIFLHHNPSWLLRSSSHNRLNRWTDCNETERMGLILTWHGIKTSIFWCSEPLAGCLRRVTVENISVEGTEEARWQRRGILLKLQHVDIHIYHLPSFSTHSLFAIRTVTSHQKHCGDKQSPLFELSDVQAIRLAYVIGPEEKILCIHFWKLLKI